MQIKLSISLRPQYTDTRPTSLSANPRTPGAWQGKPLECQCLSHWYDSTRKKKSRRQRDSNPGSSALEADALTTRPTRAVLSCRSGAMSLVLACMVSPVLSPPTRRQGGWERGAGGGGGGEVSLITGCHRTPLVCHLCPIPVIARG